MLFHSGIGPYASCGVGVSASRSQWRCVVLCGRCSYACSDQNGHGNAGSVPQQHFASAIGYGWRLTYPAADAAVLCDSDVAPACSGVAADFFSNGLPDPDSSSDATVHCDVAFRSPGEWCVSHADPISHAALLGDVPIGAAGHRGLPDPDSKADRYGRKYHCRHSGKLLNPDGCVSCGYGMSWKLSHRNRSIRWIGKF